MKTVNKKSVCIIGAGISGIVTAKTFHVQGHDVVVYERSADLGGVWELSRSYPGIQTQTPRDLYCYSDFPMPKDYPEWPRGEQVYEYLNNYVDHFKIRDSIRFNTTVLNVTERADGKAGWDVAIQTANGTTETHSFDFVVICNGTFSDPNRIQHAGYEAFLQAGGQVIHSSQYTDPQMIKGKRVMILGFSKSATDVAVNTVKENASQVTLVYRKPVWKIPYFFGNAINFKNILYSRMSEALFPPYRPNGKERLLHRIGKPMVWMNWRMLELLLKTQFRLKKCDMMPDEPIESQISCSLSIETPGFYKMVRQGKINGIRGTIDHYDGKTVVLTNGERVETDVVIMAIGWTRTIPFLSPQLQQCFIDDDGMVRLYRSIVNPKLPNMGFIGYNGSFISTLTSEISANWLLHYMDNQLAHIPTADEMHQEIDEMCQWRRTERPIASEYSGLCVAPYHFRYIDSLMTDIGAKRKTANPVTSRVAPINPKVYAKLLTTKPAYQVQ
ncbi:MAG: NAD(P)/FAD-dependent oxidoreductase [Anaerolineae bacterium]|nr:NAD(P)/FAD-dependent oxidoreductase [Anaerolineae bacterium]